MAGGRPVKIEWGGTLRPRRDVIRELARGGLGVAEIARRLRVLYQIV